MDNKALEHGNRITMAVPSAVTKNMPIVIGRGTSPNFGLAGVAANSYTPPTGTPSGQVTVDLDGVFFLEVTAKDAIGGSNVALRPGDRVYADGGTYDLTTNVLHTLTLNANPNGCYFGNVLDAVTAGATTTVRVRLKKAA